MPSSNRFSAIDDREVAVDRGGLMLCHKGGREHQRDVGLSCELVESRCRRLRLDVEMAHRAVGDRLARRSTPAPDSESSIACALTLPHLPSRRRLKVDARELCNG